MNSQLIKIRPATAADARELLEIYAPYVTGTAITFEYEVPSVEEFAGRIENTLKKFPYLVALDGDKIVGYAYVSPFKSRAAYDWAVESSIYIAMDTRGKGVGKKLYLLLEEIMKRQNILNMNACISYPNPGSIAFHERLGYKTIGHFHQCGYKLDTWYDMVWMEKFIGEHQLNPLPILPFSAVKEEFFD